MNSHPGFELPRARYSTPVGRAAALAALLLALAPAASVADVPSATPAPAPRLSLPERITFPKSIGRVAPATSAPASPSFGRVARTNLTADELSATMRVRISLRMPHLAELTRRVHFGEKISQAEME